METMKEVESWEKILNLMPATNNFSEAAAFHFAKIAHAAQKRKFSGAPYIVHPVSVSLNAGSYFEDRPATRDKAIVTALLHDTVEDTEATHESIRAIFGEEIADNVKALTKPELSFGNRAARKQKMADDLAVSNEVVKVVKMCDIMDNLPDMAHNDPSFVREKYLDECKLIFNAIKDGNEACAKRCQEIITWVEGFLNAPPEAVAVS